MEYREFEFSKEEFIKKRDELTNKYNVKVDKILKYNDSVFDSNRWNELINYDIQVKYILLDLERLERYKKIM